MIMDPDAWGIDQLRAEIARRGAAAGRARELPVDYYRIGYRLSWPLPITARPQDFPAPIPGIPTYPWLVWIGWGLEERWAALHNAGATETVLRELAALAGWSTFVDDSDQAGLITASIALWLTRGLDAADGPARAELAGIADRLITESLLPRYRRERTEPPADDLRRLQNIRLIPLFTAGRLAAVLDHPALPEVRELADQAVSLWVRLRRDAGYTEGVGYDGYLTEHLLEWLAVAPDQEASDEIRQAALSWPATAVPGRPEVQVPFGDIEPEMTQWLTVVAAVAATEPGLAAWCRTVPLRAFPSAALARMLAWPETAGTAAPKPAITGVRQPGAVALRTVDQGLVGEVLVAVATPRVEVGHLHHDAGQVILGWRGRTWISDPGYQQYRAGAEQDFTLDHGAHNAPVIDGAGQTRRGAVLAALSATEAVVDLGGCYPESGGPLRRTVRLDEDTVLIRDDLAGATEVITHWLAAGDLHWQFVDGWARLSVDDQEEALWFGCSSTNLSARWLGRHPGSRGQLTLTVPTTTERTDWVLVLDPSAGWQPPSKSILEKRS
ncbi:heparinase II/III domain-containing protein [Microlunatus parietis]|uniref:Heparinase II/III-like C-terminal domain-containing protein n=1 Tax=Microlunatus parietis TaxID=682979 RepID=A0A7Y9LBH4_9ACTN|nr:heparinase II/III family protein [Microlunatus parietis]NYE69841.1 hypothetical protein [Microlunatus parietis]